MLTINRPISPSHKHREHISGSQPWMIAQSLREILAESVPMLRDLAVAKAKNVKMSGNHFLSRIVRVILRRPG